MLVKHYFKKVKNKFLVDIYAQKSYHYVMQLNKYIKRKRQEMGMSQKSLSKLLGVGQPSVAKYETGKVIPSGSVLWRFLTTFKLIKK